MKGSVLRWNTVSGFRLAAAAALLVLAAGLGLKAAGLASAAGLNFAVNDTSDRVDARIGDGVCGTSAGTCTLRAAIQEANAVPGPDAIQLPAGTYALTIPPQGVNGSAVGDLDITDALSVVGAGASSTIVDGGTPPAGAPPEVRGLDRLFEVALDGGAVTLSGLTLSDGYAAEYGGALMNSGSATVTIADSVLRGSAAGKTGGAIENHAGGTIRLLGSTLTQNYAVEGGSALNNNLNGHVEVANSTVSANSAAAVGLDETLRGAGAIANNAEHDEVGTIAVVDSTISDNRAGGGRSGAGIWNKGTGRITVDNTTFSKNWSDGDGGAIYSGPGEVSVSDSTFSENGGNNGGAISSGGTLTVLDSVFRKNAADDWGGGVHNYNLGGVAIASTAFTENTALSGGGLANEGSGLVTVESSTFLKNVAVVSAVLDSGDGGGMHSNSGGEVVVDASTFTENRARGGGGFSNGGGGIVRISSSRFSANTADERGGGILVEGGDVRMVDIDVVGNISKSVGEGGGGIAFAGDKSASVGESAALERSRIRDNKTDGEGGGIDSRGDGPFAISMTTITGNTAATGGALHHVGDAPLLVSRSTLARNVAEHGGGVFVDGDGEAAVENSTVSANRAGQFGGGVLVSSRVSVRHSTVVDNNAPSGGGINNGGGPLIGDGFVFLANSIVANNPTGGNCVGTITSLGGNIENTSTCQLLAGGDQPGTPPLLGPLADNGGPTQTHALLSGSPAQDAAVCTELEPCPEVDQRGIPRPLFDGHDVGAYESELLPGGEPPPPPVGECPKLPNLLIADRDSWISQSSATSNSGSDSSLKVKTQGGSNSRVLVGFPLPPLPEGCTTIASAVLRLNASSAKEGHALAVLQATGGWSESGVTWANQPPTAGPAATTPSGQGVLEWDVTAQLLGSYVSGNHGLLVRDTAENGNGDEQTFNSREKANDGPPELLLVFDDRTPETSIDSGPASPTDQASATVAFSSDEADATFECSLDGAPFSSCSSPHSTGALGEGPHSFEVRATRRIRAVDPTPARHEWTVAIPPETSIAGPASPSSSPAATVTFTSDDPDATFECSANGSTFADCTTPVEYADLGDGEQEVRVRAVDPFGNADPTPAVHRWTVAVPPETSITERPADPSNSTSARVVFGGSDNGTPPSQLAFECSLDGAPFAACSSPATYDGLAEGAHAFEVRAIDLAGHVDGSPASLAWTVDVTPPQTSVDSGPDDPTNSASAQLAFSADEEARFECSLDGAPFAACSSPAGYEGLADGRHTFAVKAIDAAGNADVSAAGHEWTVDTTAPETSIDSGPRDPSNNSSAVFSFAANEQARFECSLDGAPLATCSSPTTYAGLAEGRHSLEVRAVDPAGNAEAEPAAHTWTVDLTAPESTIGAAPADPSRLAAAAFEFSADEDGVSFECRLDGEAFGSCSSPRAYEGLAEGRHGFEVRAVDAAGNVEPAAALHEWTIDLTAPQTSIDTGPPDPSSSTSAAFAFSADEPVEFACSLDGALFVACSSPQTYEALAEGAHELRVQATDVAGNADPAPAVYTWSIDLTPPDTTLGARPADPTSSTSAGFSFAAGEPATFECSLDGAAFAACSSPAGYEGLAEGRHTLQVRATDRAGNREPEPASYSWSVDLTAPVTTIDSAPADPSREAAASFAFSAGEEASFSCSLDGAPFAPCSSPQSYTALAEGGHRFEVRATDRAGNVEVEPAVHAWRVDLTAPETTVDAGPADPTAATSAELGFSADEASSFECRLDGGAFGPCSSPHSYLLLDEGAHVFQVRAVDLAGNVDPSPATYGWRIDLTPPETSIDSRPADPTTSTSASFAFSTGEPATFACSLDGAPFAPCSSPQSYEGLGEGSHTFEVRATDAVGNVEPEPAAAAWTVDRTAPATSVGAGPGDSTNQTSASIEFSSSEPGSTFACSLDGAPYAACSSPVAYEGLAEGGHVFEVRAADRAGNVDASPAAHRWTIDLTPPDTLIVLQPADPTSLDQATFEFAADEAASFECRLDGGTFVACSSPHTYLQLGEGLHVFEVRATDRAGNVDPSAAGATWRVDLAAPDTSVDSGPADPTSDFSATFAFSADGATTFECSLDGAPFAGCTSPASYSGLGEGRHTFSVRGIDAVGNVDPTPASYLWTVDQTPPDTSIDSRPPDPTNSTSAAFTFSADEPGSTFACALDGAPFAACGSTIAYAALEPGTHSLQVRATDPAGNADPTPAGYSWRIDVDAPATTISSAPNDPTADSSATLEFAANEAATFECRLDGGSFAACSSPRTYAGLAEGPHDFEVRAVDLAGNVDPSPASYGWTVDLTPPATAIDSGPPTTTTSTTATFAFSSDEQGSTFECSLDGGPYAACASPTEYQSLPLAGHEFRVRAIDRAGNLDATPALYSWTIEAPPDTTAPETTIVSAPPALSSSASASFAFSSSKPGSTFECSLDGAAFAACASPQGYASLSSGTHEFRVRARDAAGTVDPTPALHAWAIDTVAPETSIGSGPPALTSSTSASFSFTAGEPGSVFECALDSAAFEPCSSPRLYSSLAAGGHRFQVRATDAAGNVDATPAIHSWTIDTAAPDTSITTAPPVLTSSTSAAFAFSSSEAGSSFQCSLDGAAFAACVSPRQYTGLAAGGHQFRVRAVDAAGNADGTPAAYTWTIDVTAPQTTVVSGPPATTTSTSASFTFSSSEPGSTFECSLDTAPFTACSSPRDYTGLAVGSHQFRVRARDGAGNVDASPASFSWTISPPAPACSTPVILNAVADAWIDENSPSTNKGTDSILKVQSKGPRDNFRALVRFPLPPVPPGCVVDRALLRLYAASMKPDRVLQALRLVASWAENGVTWSNQPQTTGPAATTPSGFGYREWDVSEQTRAMLAEGVGHGFQIRDAVEGADAEQQFHSREKGASVPQLVVQFTLGG